MKHLIGKSFAQSAKKKRETLEKLRNFDDKWNKIILPCYRFVIFFFSLVENEITAWGQRPGPSSQARIMFVSTRFNAGLLSDCVLQSDWLC